MANGRIAQFGFLYTVVMATLTFKSRVNTIQNDIYLISWGIGSLLFLYFTFFWKKAETKVEE